MIDIDDYKAREVRCREQASLASDPDVKWLYEDMAHHYRRLISRAVHDANTRIVPIRPND